MAPLLGFIGKAIASVFVSKTIERVQGDVKQVSSGITEILTSDDDVQKARELPMAPSHGTWFDVLIDGISRLPRPAMAFWVMGILFGFWSGPDFATIDTKVVAWIEYIMGFFFGHRAMARDIPSMISGITKSLRK